MKTVHTEKVLSKLGMKSKGSLKTVHRENKGTPTDFLINKIGCHRSFNTTFGLALPLPTLPAAHLLH
jgi:hypothetical protein